MPCKRFIRGSLAVVLASAATLATFADSGDDSDPQRGLLEQIRHDPEHYQRLLRDAQVFHDLPPAARERIQRLARELNAEPSPAQVRLLRVAERYADWRAQLSEADRARLDSETEPDKRLKRIKELRQRQWVERLPANVRADLQTRKDSDRIAQLDHLRNDERRSQYEWRLGSRLWDDLVTRGAPDRLDKLPPEVQTFVRDSLLPRLHPNERKELSKAEGNWPIYPRTLVRLADKENVAFRLLSPVQGPGKMSDLPADLQRQLRQSKWPEMKKFRLFNGQTAWPEFAVEITRLANENKIPLPRPFGWCTPKEFPKPTRDFITHKLHNWNSGILDKKDRKRLREAEGSWPLYPILLLELAREHHLVIPGASLPGPAESWNPYRDRPLTSPASNSAVSDLALRVFARTELNDDERAEYGTALHELAVRARLQQEYIHRHPDEWKRLLEADRKRRK